MASGEGLCPITAIGETAGAIWRVLKDGGPAPLAKLVKAVGGSRDAFMQGLGWLAREDKIAFEDRGRTRVVSLREVE